VLRGLVLQINLPVLTLLMGHESNLTAKWKILESKEYAAYIYEGICGIYAAKPFKNDNNVFEISNQSKSAFLTFYEEKKTTKMLVLFKFFIK
jgi:hypothetical protein